MKRQTAILSAVALATILTGCNTEKKTATPPPKLTELTAYTAKKDGDWLNVEDVWRVKENASLQFQKFGEWVGASWFRVDTMRRRGYFFRPADTVLSSISEENGVNPTITYSCIDQAINLDFGKAIRGITDRNKVTSHYTLRFDGQKHFSELAYQINPRRTKGVNPATGKSQKPPKGISETYTTKKWNSLSGIDPKDPWSNLYTAKTIELSVVDNPKELNEGIYAKWNLPMSLKEMKASGDLDKACKALLGADYITVSMVSEQVRAEKKAAEQKAKQIQAETHKAKD